MPSTNFDENGDLVKGTFVTKKQVLELSYGLGITNRWSAGVRFPFVYKKTKLDGPEAVNYRRGRNNVYGTLFEEAFVDYVDHHELWKLWEADLPTLGDVEVWTNYSFYQKLEPTTSFVLEVLYKAPTGNDNPRRGNEVRSYLTTGTPDTYVGLGFKQEAWKFSFAAHGGYNWRMEASTKHSAGTVDLADEAKGDFEVAFQMPEVDPFWGSFAMIGTAHYKQRLWNSRITDNQGNVTIMEDTPGSLLTVEPKLQINEFPLLEDIPVLSLMSKWESFFSADIPVSGQRTFLPRSEYQPPWDLETYEGVGITYSLGLIKRWQ
ncbi:MAG: hypothetical protein M5R36_16475 [Deltaproteobacteria bacterium]|nr:hypothetical protein [Deltaproteobacteria bacterium]